VAVDMARGPECVAYAWVSGAPAGIRFRADNERLVSSAATLFFATFSPDPELVLWRTLSFLP